MEASRHIAEDRRVAALQAYGILDTPREAEFDAIVKVVSTICGAPISVINLIDKERQWFKAEVGLGVRETPRPASICAHAILQPGLFIVPDTLEDRRFADNPLVTGVPHLRFYAGALLETPDGLPLGTICVLDYKPRQLDDSQQALLRLMAQQIMKLIELRRINATERRARKRAEVLVEATGTQLVDAEREARLREQFIAVLGHDLRNPLASIKAGTELLGKRVGDPRETLRLMQGSVSRMSALIDDIMDFARGRLGNGIEIGRSDVLLAPLLRQVIDELRGTASGREIVADLTVDTPIHCDAGRVGQLFSNLLANALTHGTADTPVRVSAHVADGWFELSLSNSGPPIPPAALERLFQPFFRGEARSSQQGLGLGLYIAFEIARAHGGILTARSSPERTTFTFRMRVR
ncbi:MAG TPA: GAF domain-containing sensor histidine kinase, partial [Vicinamibacterales bacterium]|nr:GAF domain-containing sensor histidine kinase [Vicinamibacterales bacterium]